MKFTTTDRGLIISANDADRAWLKWWRGTLEIPAYFGTEDCLFRYLSGPMMDAGYVWIKPEEVGALTAAPIIGRRAQNGKVTEAFGYMDYQVCSPLDELMNRGEIFLQRG